MSIVSESLRQPDRGGTPSLPDGKSRVVGERVVLTSSRISLMVEHGLTGTKRATGGEVGEMTAAAEEVLVSQCRGVVWGWASQKSVWARSGYQGQEGERLAPDGGV